MIEFVNRWTIQRKIFFSSLKTNKNGKEEKKRESHKIKRIEVKEEKKDIQTRWDGVGEKFEEKVSLERGGERDGQRQEENEEEMQSKKAKKRKKNIERRKKNKLKRRVT